MVLQNQKTFGIYRWFIIFLSMVLFFSHSVAVSSADYLTIMEKWDQAVAPAPVTLQAVTIRPEHSAFLVLDIEERTCNTERRPRCIESVAGIKRFLEQSRNRGLTVVYSLTSKGRPETILADVTPLKDEPIVQSSVDKFYNTHLDDILKSKEIRTVIVVGTAAEGAVLHTATGAAIRGYQVIVPVDGVSASTLYAEQYTAWHLLNAPGTRGGTTLTRFDMIAFEN